MATSADFNELLHTLSAFEETVMDTPGTRIGSERSSNSTSSLTNFPYRSNSSELLEFGSQLGQGGMGEVHLAQQRSTGRSVAVKRVRADWCADTTYQSALLSEGWLMASLEHPNIPPVHDVIVNEEGQPLVLLKRIEGDQWLRLMHDAEAVQERFGESLESWNLHVLGMVCHAVSYAHSKRIIHRDLKPENVMIGAFGEVYVLDWGIAVALDRDPEGRLPYIGDSAHPVGTPCYMAPELLAEDPSRVDVRTDVYLIGAMLYEALTGKPPHLGKSMRAIAQSIASSLPSFPEEAPPALVKICVKAMQADRDQRYQSVEELQQALRHYESRRASELLTQKAYKRVENLRELAQTPLGKESWLEMVSLFSECRFGFRRAIELFTDEDAAQEGLREAAELMCERALAEGHSDAAATFLQELAAPSQVLVDQVEQARAKNREGLERLSRFERLGDTDLSREKRVILVVMLALTAGLSTFVAEFLTTTSLNMVVINAAWQVLLLLGFVGLYRRFKLEETENNRLIFVVILAALGSQLIVSCVAWISGMSVVSMNQMYSGVWLAAAVIATLAMGWVYIPTTLAAIGVMVVSSIWPAHFYYALAGASMVMALNFGSAYVFKIRPRSLMPDS
jgi:serine/threonine-protein kinase